MNKSTNINITPKRGNSISRALNTATRKARAFNTENNKTMKGLKDTMSRAFNKPKVNKEQSVSHENIDLGFVQPNEEKGDGDADTDTEHPSRAAEALQQSRAARARADQLLQNDEQLNKPLVRAATKLQAVHRGRMERKKQAVEKDDDIEVVKVHGRKSRVMEDGRQSRVVVDKEEEQEDSDDDKEKIMTEKPGHVVKADAVITSEKDGAGVGVDNNQLADEANRTKVVPDNKQLAEKEAWPVLDKDMADIEAHLEHDMRTRRSVEEAKRDEEKDALAALEKYVAWQEARKKDEPVRKKDEPVDEPVDKIPVKSAPKAGWPTPSEFTRKTINAAAYGSKVANDWTLGLGEFKSEYKKIISKILNEKFFIKL
jgi:hypothetical protein